MKIVTYKIKIQYNLRIMKVIPTLSFITLIFLSAGCIRENRSGCGGYLSLKFRYTDSNGAPLTPGFPETDHLSVFVFDRQGIFVCERKDSALQLDHYMMEMPLPPIPVCRLGRFIRKLPVIFPCPFTNPSRRFRITVKPDNR